MPDFNENSNTPEENMQNAMQATSGVRNAAGKAAKKVGKEAVKKTGKAAKNTAKLTFKVAKKGISTIFKIIAGTSSGGWLLIIILVVIIVLNMIMSVLAGLASSYSNTDNELTTEGQQIMRYFKSYATNSTDPQKSDEYGYYQDIINNGYSTALCAVWRTIVYDCYYTYQDVSDGGASYKGNESDRYETAADWYLDQYFCIYYMRYNSKTNRYKIQQFDDNGKERDDYVNDQSHYYYAENIMRMCLEAFVDPDTGKVFEKGKIKKTLPNVYKNLRGKNGLVENCLVYKQIPVDEDDTRQKLNLYMDTYLNLDSETADKYYDDNIENWNYYTDHHFTKSFRETILSYISYFTSTDGGSASDIVDLALKQEGNSGKKYWNAVNGGTPNNWCAMFCKWLMDQCGINSDDVGWAASCTSWINSAKSLGVYKSSSSSYSPKAGDFIFFHYYPNDGYLANHVGIITSIDSDGTIHTVEGNTGGGGYTSSKVGIGSYSSSYSYIAGYIKMTYDATSSEALLTAEVIDKNYVKKYNIKPMSFTASQKKKLLYLISNENGVNGYEGCCLVAQCLRDTMACDSSITPDNIRSEKGYVASDSSGTITDDARKAYKYIFTQGNYAVQHRIMYFYNPSLCESSWHESQLFVIEHGLTEKTTVRYFDSR